MSFKLTFIQSALVLALGASALSSAVAAPGGWLVSPSEVVTYKGKQGFEAELSLRAKSIGPTIDVLQPVTSPQAKVKAPFAIIVEFKSLADSPINPASFKVLYGAMKFDITNRLAKLVKVTPEGFTLDNAKIPPGKHRLTLQIADEKERIGERELRFEVE
jgi:hypothetical protein